MKRLKSFRLLPHPFLLFFFFLFFSYPIIGDVIPEKSFRPTVALFRPESRILIISMP